MAGQELLLVTTMASRMVFEMSVAVSDLVYEHWSVFPMVQTMGLASALLLVDPSAPPTVLVWWVALTVGQEVQMVTKMA